MLSIVELKTDRKGSADGQTFGYYLRALQRGRARQLATTVAPVLLITVESNLLTCASSTHC